MNVAQHTAPDHAATEADGTVTATIAALNLIAGSITFHVELPEGLPRERMAGRYFLARCAEATAWSRTHDWTLTLRRSLYVAGWRKTPGTGETEEWLLASSALADPGIEWLAARPVGAAINLIGPLGNGFELPGRARHLTVISDPARVLTLLPLVHEMLDRGGRVVLLLESGEGIDAALRDRLPLSAEVHQDAPGDAWQTRMTEALAWADCAAVALPGNQIQSLAHSVQRARRRVEPGFLQVLADVRMACGYGACHACLVALGNGRWTRACIHGPVFDLAELSR